MIWNALCFILHRNSNVEKDLLLNTKSCQIRNERVIYFYLKQNKYGITI